MASTANANPSESGDDFKDALSSESEPDTDEEELEEEKKSSEHYPKKLPPTLVSRENLQPFRDTKTPRSAPLPVICLREGLKRKASALELQSWVALALTLDGRDKITKVFQYSARLLAWWLAGTNQAKRFAALKVSLTTSRKAFRLGRSLIEYHRLRTMGLLETLGWHWERSLIDADTENGPRGPPSFFRQASSNIGLGPMSLDEDKPEVKRGTILRSLSSVAYRMYRPLAVSLSAAELAAPLETPLWKLVGSAFKMLGLSGFWAGDNISFLTSSGLFDNYKLDPKERMAKRKQLQTRASHLAYQCYFGGAVAGLLVSLRSYWTYREETMRELQKRLNKAESEEEKETAQRSLDKAKEKQFFLFLALLKSSCDVLIFSNNPGIDLWKKRYGRKMHEGFHCMLGLISASTVLYNNFPNVKK